MLAVALNVTVTIAVAAAASVPPVDETVTHDCVAPAVQAMGSPPVFVMVYVSLEGVKGPPSGPDDVSAVPGVTVMTPGGGGFGRANRGDTRRPARHYVRHGLLRPLLPRLASHGRYPPCHVKEEVKRRSRRRVSPVRVPNYQAWAGARNRGLSRTIGPGTGPDL